jgi:diaminohydroxyphosphoribosylaminopyrimidine deaminase / 5-amino-6-(5-phosphoribosylamino)uracil reductase
MTAESSPVWHPQDLRCMKRALSLARKGIGRCSPNPPVGCVLADSSGICGEGYHLFALRDHAEAAALGQAGDRARGATAYVSLEPCAHHGRTPPCANRLIEAGIRRVVVSCMDPNPLVSGKGISLMREAGIQVDVGLFSGQALRLIESFACHIVHRRPLVVSKVGMTLDGRIGLRGTRKAWINSEGGRAFGQGLRLELDAILAGSGTILADNPILTYRGRKQKEKPLLRVILDARLRTPPTAAVFTAPAGGPVLIFASRDAPAGCRTELEARGAEVCIVDGGEGRGVNLGQVLEELGTRGIMGVLVEGGGDIHWSFLKERLVDKFYFVIAPMVLGGTTAVPAVGGAGYPGVEDAARFRIRTCIRCGDDMAIEAYPANSRSILSPWATL